MRRCEGRGGGRGFHVCWWSDAICGYRWSIPLENVGMRWAELRIRIHPQQHLLSQGRAGDHEHPQGSFEVAGAIQDYMTIHWLIGSAQWLRSSNGLTTDPSGLSRKGVLVEVILRKNATSMSVLILPDKRFVFSIS